MNVWYRITFRILWSCTLWDFMCLTVLDQYVLFLRAETAKLDELCGSAHGVVWWRSAQGSHVDSWLKLQSHRPEWKGPEPRTGHHWGLCLLQTPFLCGMVLLERRNTGDVQQFYFTCADFLLYIHYDCRIIFKYHICHSVFHYDDSKESFKMQPNNQIWILTSIR